MIGLGPWGQKVANRIGDLPEFQWVGLCDRSFKDLSTFSQRLGATPFRSTKSLFDFYLPDLLLISTPVENHYDLIKEGLLKGCHVWVTKPIVLHSKQLTEILEISTSKNLRVFFDHTFCFSERFKAIQNFLPLLSPIKTIDSKRGHWGGQQNGTTALEELIYHDIYMSLLWSRQTPVGISFKHLDQGDEPTEQLTLHFQSSLTINLQASHGWRNRTRMVTITGSDWKIDWNDDALTNPVALKKPGFESGSIQSLEHGPDAIHSQMVDVAQCLLENKTPLVEAEQALQVLKIIELARESLHRGGEMVSYA